MIRCIGRRNVWVYDQRLPCNLYFFFTEVVRIVSIEDMALFQDDGSATVTEGGMMEASIRNDSLTEQDIENGRQEKEVGKEVQDGTVDWEDDPHNPQNWPASKKAIQVTMLSSSGLLAYVALSRCTDQANILSSDQLEHLS